MRQSAIAYMILSAVTAVVASGIPVPVVIWHGLGDQYSNPGLISLQHDLQKRFDGIFVHLIRIEEDGSADLRSTFFGNANAQVELVCQQLRDLPQLVDPLLNPSGRFDAIGFSQGGQLLRAVLERCGPFTSSNSSTASTAFMDSPPALRMRNLITVGSQHLGISSLPPCPPNASPFSSCHLMHLSLVKAGLYSSYAQRHILPAQYVRDEKRIDEYLEKNEFLRDINNERIGDREVGGGDDDDVLLGRRADNDGEEKRNAIYRKNFLELENLVLLRFSYEATVVPPQSAHFTLPSPSASNCPSPANPALPPCYQTPVAWSDLPLYAEDYIGLKRLDERGRVWKDVCEGAHMQIDGECWEGIVSWLGTGEGMKSESKGEPSVARFLIQL